MKKVLIITYYWIPSGGAGVQRWVKFAKYLPENGWQPIIYAPENPEYPSEDPSFLKDVNPDTIVLKQPIWEPYNIYRTLFGKQGEKINAGFISENKRAGWKEQLSIAIRGNLLIPDPRKFWIKPSVRYLSDYLTENAIDTIITTGPPHSMHLIGVGLKRKMPHLRWIADFRDPWTEIDFYKDLKLTRYADRKHHKMEKMVLQTADDVIVVSEGMRENFQKKEVQRLHLITNGFDDEDTTAEATLLDEKFSLSHIGTLNAARNPKALWKVLGKMAQKSSEFKASLRINLVGKIDYAVLKSIEDAGLKSCLDTKEYLPHNEAITQQQQAQVLLLLINNVPNAKGILTGKLFEYLAAHRPILAVAPPNGDVAKVLKQTEAGETADFEDEEKIEEIIKKYYSNYQQGTLHTKDTALQQYSRRYLTKKLAEILA